jgi:hypothetical protein
MHIPVCQMYSYSCVVRHIETMAYLNNYVECTRYLNHWISVMRNL